MSRSPSRGQATIGYALVIGIALIGTVTVVTLGATALTDIQGSSQSGAAEQAMTQFDSRAAQVALGDSQTQEIGVGQSDGSYRVDPDAGNVRIVHVDFDGDTTDDGNDVNDSATDDDELLYEADLGTVYYEQNDRTLGYQAGGVWRRSRSGSTMVSPPEFHYRGSTLTFPIVRVNQETRPGVNPVQSGSGSIDLRVSRAQDSEDVFPTRQNGYPSTDDDDGDGDFTNDDGYAGPDQPFGGDGDDGDNDGGNYRNPATNGTVVVYVESEFYGAWAEYFRTRTDGNVSTSDTDEGRATTADDPDGDGPMGVVAVEIESTGFSGPFTMPGDGSSIFLRGIEDHSMTDFDITLAPDKQDSANFNNLQWSLYADEGGQEFEMNLRKDTGGDCDNQEFILSIFYSPEGTDNYHGWRADGLTGECVGDDGDETRLTVDFVDDEDGDGTASELNDDTEDDFNMTYTQLSTSDVTHFSLSGRSVMSPTLDQHMSEPNKDSGATYTDGNGDELPVDSVVNHYFSLLGPGIDLTVDDKNSNTVTESASGGTIYYGGGSSFITYMHITENDVTVRID
jgi:hypothetical protein